MKFEKGKAEKIVSSLISEWMKEGDIFGKTMNKANLQKFNDANIMAAKFFEDVPDVEFQFEVPAKNKSFVSTDIVCQIIEFERTKDGSSEKADLLQELMTTADYFAISPVSPASIHLSFSINDIWME